MTVLRLICVYFDEQVGPDLVGMKFTLYLTEVGAESGALRCIPGSHGQDFSDKIHTVPLADRNAWEGEGEEGGLAVRYSTDFSTVFRLLCD